MAPTTRNQNPGCLAPVLNLFHPSAKKSELPLPYELPYRLRESILSPAEISFFKILQNTAQGKVEIHFKVRLADIFYTAYGTNISYFNRIAEKHIDFLLCDPHTMKPILGIELDDSSHKKPSREKRDEFVDKTFEAAGLPLVRIPVKQTYCQQEIATQLKQALSTKQA